MDSFKLVCEPSPEKIYAVQGKLLLFNPNHHHSDILVESEIMNLRILMSAPEHEIANTYRGQIVQVHLANIYGIRRLVAGHDHQF